jgi:hypothetical protein
MDETSMTMQMRSNRRPSKLLLLVVSIVAMLGVACGNGNSGFPKDPGQYKIQPNSLSFDGKMYSLLWADAAGGLHKADGKDVRMQKDETTFLEVGNGSPIVHLKEDEAVTVKGQDRDGPFESFWFPFFLGQTIGGLGGRGPVVINQPYPGESAPRGAGYQYPPTDSFGRGDDLHGSVQRSKAEIPDYSKVQPAPYAVSGQSSGTGAGNAASNKSVGPASGQSGGTGAGDAASNKGTFASSNKTSGGGTGVNGGAGFGSSPANKPSVGSGNSSNSRPSVPSRPSSPVRSGRR